MKYIVAFLGVLLVLTAGLAVYSEIQRREDAKQIKSLSRTIHYLDSQLGSYSGDLQQGQDLQADAIGANGLSGEVRLLSDRVDSLCVTVTSATC
jgi:hypothetical protein